MWKKLLFSIILLVFPFFADATHKYYFKSYSVEDGLSQNMVYDIIQDSTGFIWLGTQNGLNRFDGRRFKVYKKQDTHNLFNSLGSDAIFSLEESSNGKLLIGTKNGLYIYNPITELFSKERIYDDEGKEIDGTIRDILIGPNGTTYIAVSEKGVAIRDSDGATKFFYINNILNPQGQIRQLCLDKKGNIWVGTHGRGLVLLNYETGTIKEFLIDDDANSPKNNIDALILFDNNTLILGTEQKGIKFFDVNNLKFINNKFSIPEDSFVHTIFKASDNSIWIGTENGLYIYSASGRLDKYKYSPNDQYSISDNAIYSICEDSDKGMWIGSFFGGVSYYSDYLSQFEKYYPISGSNTISGKSISEICETSNGNIWIGTEDAGLNMLESGKKDTFTKGFIDALNIHSLAEVNGDLWVGTYRNGLYSINLNTRKTRHFNSDKLKDDNIYALLRDRNQNVWVGTLFGMYLYKDGEFAQFYPQVITTQVNDIIDDNLGSLWIATLGQGVLCYNFSTKELSTINEELSKNNFTSNNVICLLLDASQNLWIGTEGDGLYYYDIKKGMLIRRYSESDGLPNNVIYKLLQDDDGKIWGSTNHGLFCLDYKTNIIKNYNHHDGLLCDQFNYKSGVKLKDGSLMFGGVKGLIKFNPSKLKNPLSPPEIVFNSFQISNQEVNPWGNKCPISKSIIYEDNIVLKHNQSVFSIGFSCLLRPQARSTRFYYRLAGLENDWNLTDESSVVTYSNVRAGKYAFEVKAVNEEHLWDDVIKKINIRIKPPIYATNVAFLIYIISGIAIILLIVLFSINRVKEKNKIKLAKLEREKETELYNAKIDFFTNITHEIRTPLTLINGPLEDVMSHISKRNPDYENLSMIQRNSNRLLKLANELLDFRNLEKDNLRLNYIKKDIVKIIHELTESFLPSFSAKNIIVHENYSEKSIYADIDEDIIVKIISNLLNNAYKHAEKIVMISISVRNSIIKISVANDGDKIPAEKRDEIFSPFVKLDPNSEGVGLGLPFARTLAKSHNGDLVLGDDENRTVFELTFPQEQPDKIVLLEDMNGAGGFQEETQDASCVNSELCILIVDDNPDFLLYLTKKLRTQYSVLSANSGEQAINIIEKNQIDLVISDVMMPHMNGYELCKTIKEDLRYSHIPVILLTAKSDIQSKVDGLKIGADEYISKPFSSELLLARIQNLIENRNKIREAFKHSASTSFKTIAHSKADEEFLDAFNAVIDKRMGETELDINDFASEMHMSRATFFRKVKNVSGMTPNEYIRLSRLKKAAELLKGNEYRVNEIAIIVGFSSSSYFTKCFYKQFGILPKDFSAD